MVCILKTYKRKSKFCAHISNVFRPQKIDLGTSKLVTKFTLGDPGTRWLGSIQTLGDPGTRWLGSIPTLGDPGTRWIGSIQTLGDPGTRWLGTTVLCFLSTSTAGNGLFQKKTFF